MVTYALPYSVIDILEYIDIAGRCPFGNWFARLDVQAAAKIAVGLTRIANGNLSNVKTVGGDVMENRIDFGPGYRVYFGRDGERLIILLLGGSKQRQTNDIETAKRHWADYKRRKHLKG